MKFRIKFQTKYKVNINFDVCLMRHVNNAKHAYLNEKLRDAESQISILQKQVARTNKQADIDNLAKYKRIKAELNNKIHTVEAETEGYLLEISEVCTEQDILWLRKRSYEFLKLVAQQFVSFIEDETISLHDLKTIPLQKLALLNHETWINLLADQEDIWAMISTLSLDELEGMAEENLDIAINERGYSLEALRELFNDDEETFSYATCGNLEALIYELAPAIPDKLFEYLEETGEDIDWEDIVDNLDGTEKTMFEMNLESRFGRVPDSDDRSEDSRLFY